MSMNKSNITEEGKDRNEILGDKGLEGEVRDIFIDYKEEAVRAFVNIIE